MPKFGIKRICKASYPKKVCCENFGFEASARTTGRRFAFLLPSDEFRHFARIFYTTILRFLSLDSLTKRIECGIIITEIFKDDTEISARWYIHIDSEEYSVYTYYIALPLSAEHFCYRERNYNARYKGKYRRF